MVPTADMPADRRQRVQRQLPREVGDNLARQHRGTVTAGRDVNLPDVEVAGGCGLDLGDRDAARFNGL